MVGCVGENANTPPASATPPTPESAAIPASPSPTSIAQGINPSGTFVAGEHPTQGTVRLITREGQSMIELGEDFATSELGPDLVVILHRSDNVIGSTQPPAYPIQEGDYVVIAPLQQFQGAQRYTIPADINLADYRSVGIWCRKFNAMFGAATLS
jgi:hypothetical protein